MGRRVYPAGQLQNLIDAVRERRLQIAQRRFAQTRIRYPEVDHAEVRPLSDEEVLTVALNRELAHIEATIKNMQKDDS